MPRWELHGVGHIDPHLIGDSAAIEDNVDGTTVIGMWERDALIELLKALVTSGFDLDSARRLDVQLLAPEIS